MSFFAAFAFAAARSVAVVGKRRQTTNSSPRAPSIAKSAAGSQEALSRSLSRSESKNGSTLPRSQAKKKSTGENKEQAEESTPPPQREEEEGRVERGPLAFIAIIQSLFSLPLSLLQTILFQLTSSPGAASSAGLLTAAAASVSMEAQRRK